MAAAGPTIARTELRQYVHGDWASITDTILLPEQGAILGALAPVLVPSLTGGAAVADRLLYPGLSPRGGPHHRP